MCGDGSQTEDAAAVLMVGLTHTHIPAVHFQGDNIDPVKLVNNLDFALADRYQRIEYDNKRRRCKKSASMLIY